MGFDIILENAFRWISSTILSSRRLYKWNKTFNATNGYWFIPQIKRDTKLFWKLFIISCSFGNTNSMINDKNRIQSLTLYYAMSSCLINLKEIKFSDDFKHTMVAFSINSNTNRNLGNHPLYDWIQVFNYTNSVKI